VTGVQTCALPIWCEILRYLSAYDIPIAKYELLEPNLEQVFLEAIHP